MQDESRLDLFRALIIPPSGTPYQNGCFFFDILLPQVQTQMHAVLNAWHLSSEGFMAAWCAGLPQPPSQLPAADDWCCPASKPAVPLTGPAARIRAWHCLLCVPPLTPTCCVCGRWWRSAF